jgi:hypothetical protein
VMIVFHLSFIAMLGGIVANSLFHFRGVLRLTEGETLGNDQRESYDEVEQGRFFDPARLRGETTLVKMHTNFKIDGDNKRAAYEIEVGEGAARERRIIYITEYFDHDGVRFFCLKEGYSVLVVMSDKGGRERYGVHVPLQSLRQADGSYLYSTGTSSAAGGFPFPQPPEHPSVELQLTLWPGTVERTGQVLFQVRPLGAEGGPVAERKSMVPVGGQADAGEFVLSPREIRYWVAMDVRYDPGLTVALASLCFGLAGMVVTFVGRLRQGSARSRAA